MRELPWEVALHVLSFVSRPSRLFSPQLDGVSLYMLSLIVDNLEGLPIKVPRPYRDSIFRGQQRIAEYLDTRGGNGMVDVMGVNQAEFFLINDVLNQMAQNVSTREMIQIERMAIALYYLKGGVKVGMRHTAEFWQRNISTVWA